MRDLKVVIRFISGVLAFCCMSFFINAATNHPQRIISLGPSITEQLYLLEAQDKLIGCTIYCRSPQEAESKEKVGTVVEVNLEKIVS
ncbi:MAG: cobalamide ABC transporter substrate-binding protein, partial [Candidatus Omnitrophica bacterium]|nr:cobalamide ABC transporter substrate-binding protein [Candidatus Omnitrophota bacterium]